MGAATDTLPGILAIFNNVAPGREAEFEEWFQHEHLAERIAVPGFLIGRRHEAISGQPRYFNFYVTQSVEVLKSAAYLGRLDAPTPMTRTVMSEVFKDMIRTVCRRTFRLGAMRGTSVVTARFGERPAETALKAAIERLMRDKAVACGEIWRAADPLEFPVSLEERLRGGDRKIETCLLVETLRVPEAEKIAATLANEFPGAEIGVYRLLCEINAERSSVGWVEPLRDPTTCNMHRCPRSLGLARARPNLRPRGISACPASSTRRWRSPRRGRRPRARRS